MNKSKIIGFIAALFVCVTTASHATLLLPGEGPTTGTSGYSPAGSSLLYAEEGSVRGSNLDVTIACSILQHDASNPLGGLTFIYQVLLVTGNVAQVELGGYTGVVPLVNVADTAGSPSFGGYIVSGGTAPTSVDWLGQLDFNWGSGLGAPGNSDALIVDTAATGYRFSIGSVDGQRTNLQLPVPVPEPGPLGVAGLGTALLALWRRK